MIFNVANVVLKTPVLNASYPADVTGLSVGSSATFKVTISEAGIPDSYTYQWYVNGSAVSGATSASYTKSNLALGSYTVYCKVTNSAGAVQSRTATLTVTKQYIFDGSTFTRDMSNAYTDGGATVTISGGKVTMSSKNNQTGSAATTNAMNNVYKTLKATVNVSTGKAKIIISKSRNFSPYSGLSNALAYKETSSTGSQTITLDVSGHKNQSVYAIVGIDPSTTATFSALWFEA